MPPSSRLASLAAAAVAFSSLTPRSHPQKFGPAWAWPVYEGCIHPGVAGAPKGSGEDSASMILMEEMYAQYWSEQFGC